MGEQDNIITIDGSVGSGRHTLAAALGRHLGFPVASFEHALGSVVRLIRVRRHGLGDVRRVVNAVRALKENQLVGPCPPEDPADRLKALGLLEQAEVVEALQDRFRTLTAWHDDGGLIAVGTAMGRVVFPQAPLRLFLHADLEVREQREARRRKLATGDEAARSTIAAADLATIRNACPQAKPIPRKDFAKATIRDRGGFTAYAADPELYIVTDSLKPETLYQFTLALARQRLSTPAPKAG